MFKKTSILVASAVIVDLVAIGCGREGASTRVVGPVVEAEAPESSSSGPRLPLGLSPKGAYAVEPCIEDLEATAWGHSCAVFYPKDKAKDDAVAKAREILEAYYDAHTAIAGDPCSDGYHLSGHWMTDDTVTVLSEVKKRTDGCGWDVKVRLKATICSRCTT